MTLILRGSYARMRQAELALHCRKSHSRNLPNVALTGDGAEIWPGSSVGRLASEAPLQVPNLEFGAFCMNQIRASVSNEAQKKGIDNRNHEEVLSEFRRLWSNSGMFFL